MTVLIDTPLWPKHGTVWSHLVSDASIEELHAFAERARTCRRAAFDLDHYDVPRRAVRRARRGRRRAGRRRASSCGGSAASGLRVTPRERARPGSDSTL